MVAVAESEGGESSVQTAEAASRADSVDVSLFIATRLAEVDRETDSLTKDTMLHYGYEGENSDMEDLSELDVSDDEDEDIDDFSYIKTYGCNFHKLYVVLNPPVISTTTESEPDYEELTE